MTETPDACPLWCAADHSDPDQVWHTSRDIQVPAPGTAADTSGPLLSAALTTAIDLPHVFGTRSRLVVDTGRGVLELDVAQTDQLIANLTRFTTRLHNLRALLAVAVESDIPGDQAAIEQWHREFDARIAARDHAPQT